MNEGNQRRVSATFEATDDLLWQAVTGRLPQLPPLILGRSGFVGPLVELAIARMTTPDGYRRVTVEPPIFHQIEHALAEGAISGTDVRDRAGVSLCGSSIHLPALTRRFGINGPSTPRTLPYPLVSPKAWRRA